jgi:glucan phosphoethanolaminetransferase (alkaline phosphatase superfamily)
MKNYKESYRPPFLCFSLKFFSLTSPPASSHTLAWADFYSTTGFPVSHSWSHVTEKPVSWMDSVWLLLQELILFTVCFVIVIALKKHFFFICTHRLYRRLLPLRYILIRMFFFFFINNGIIRRRMKPSQSVPKETVQ